MTDDRLLWGFFLSAMLVIAIAIVTHAIGYQQWKLPRPPPPLTSTQTPPPPVTDLFIVPCLPCLIH